MQLLGSAQWRRADEEPVRLTAKDAALLARLALDGPQARPGLCELLWPDSPAHKGYANLRSRAYRLHDAAKTPIVEIDDEIRLNRGLEVDVLRLEQTDTVALLGAGPLLAGVDLGDHHQLDQWLGTARQRVAERVAQLLGARADALEREGSIQDALALAQRTTELTPLSEAMWYRLMLLHYLHHDRAAAQDAYWRCAALLRDELGIRPGAAMLDLMQTIEAAERPVASRHRPIPASVLRPPTLIGRDAIWQAMWTAWQQSRPFLVVGEAGIGKSRLLEEFVRGQPGVVCERATFGDEQAPYGVLGRILLQVQRQFAPPMSEATRREVGRIRSELGAPPEAPANAQVLDHALEAMLLAALGRGLQAIVLDDLQCADLATVQALRRLTGRDALAGLRLGLAARPAPPAEVAETLEAWQLASQRLIPLELPPLTSEELEQLLGSLKLPQEVTGTLAQGLFRHAGGHPLLTLATLHAALSSGGGLGPNLPRPQSIRALLDARLVALPADTHALLRLAAVAGPDLSAARMARMLGCPILDLAGRWSVLEAAGVLRGEGFAHDLMHDAALRMVPQGVRAGLHREFAAVLAADGAPPARLAWHWEQAGAMAEAGACWHRAARDARRVARLEDQCELFLRAARCHAAAGERAAQFEALMARLEGLQLRPGGGAVLAALPEAEGLADTGLQRLRCRLARTEALLGLQDHQGAAQQGGLAVQEAHEHPECVADAQALLAQALVGCRQFDAAAAAIVQALAAAESAGDRWQQLRVGQAASFVHYAAGRVPAAIECQRQAVALAQAVGHRYEAAAGEGHIAVLLGIVGDLPRSYQQARLAHRALQDVGLDEDGVLGSVNDRVLGTAAAALGRFDEAFEALQRGLRSAGARAAPAARIKALLAMAGLWITLGRPERAREALQEMPDDPDPGRSAQRHALLAQVAAAAGEPAQRHLAALARIGAEHPDLPLMRSAWFEWSFQGDAAEVVARLEPVRRQFAALGLDGTARLLEWRMLVRWLEIPGAAAAVAAQAHARALEPHVEGGINARAHPPQVWATLAQAHARAGDRTAELQCLDAARRWLERALPSVPAEHREAFRAAHPLHRELLLGRSA